MATEIKSMANCRQLLCVLGMHRSGTSVVTHFLHRLGVAIAPDLLAAVGGINEEGFWEDNRVVELNELLLKQRGIAWYDSAASPIIVDGFAEDEIKRQAIAHFKKNYTADLSVVKDPRLCRLLLFWSDVWREAGFDPYFIHVVRHPFAVAKSLHKRDKIPYELGIILWLHYTLDSMLQSAESPGTIVIYDEFLRQPLELAHRLLSTQALVISLSDSNKDSWLQLAEATIKNPLRHHDNEISVSLGFSELMTFAVSLYETLVVRAGRLLSGSELNVSFANFERLLASRSNELIMVQRLAAELMACSADNVRVGELHTQTLATIQQKDAVIADRNQMLKDIVQLKFWRLLPRLMRLMRRIDKR